MTVSTCATCGRKLTFLNRAGKTGMCREDYRRATLFYEYFDIYHPTCEAATERHVRDVFKRLLAMLGVFIAVSAIGTAIFGIAAGLAFMAAGLYLGYRAGFPSRGHPVDKLRYERFFYVFAAVMAIGTAVIAAVQPAAMRGLGSAILTRLYPLGIMLFPAIIIGLVATYAFLKRDEMVSDDAYAEWQEHHPERMRQAVSA